MRPSVAILGAGAMGKNLARGLLRSSWEPDEIVMADRFAEMAEEAERLTGITTLLDPAVAVEGRDVVVLAVKPNHVGDVLHAIAATVTTDQVVVSLAAGVPLKLLEAPLPGIPVVRTMPNTPAAVGRAMTAYCGGSYATDSSLDRASAVLAAVGEVLRVDEGDLDAVTAVSGSGPAYVFLLAEALIDAAVAEGLEESAAAQLVKQTLRGSGVLLHGSDKSASELRREVTSPGGTTAAALEVFETGGLRALVRDAVRAAAGRSRQLGDEALRSARDGG